MFVSIWLKTSLLLLLRSLLADFLCLVTFFLLSEIEPFEGVLFSFIVGLITFLTALSFRFGLMEVCE